MSNHHTFPIAWLLLALAAVVGAQNPAQTTTGTGQGLSAEVVSPLDGVQVDLCQGGPVLAAARGTIKRPPPDPVHIMYVADVSGSMEQPGANPYQDLTGDGVIDAQDDCNNDGINGSALDALCFGLTSLNDSLGSDADFGVGLIAFGSGAKTADVNPRTGQQTFLSPADSDDNANGKHDMTEVFESLDTQAGSPYIAGFLRFTADLTSGFGGSTRYDDGLEAMNDAFDLQPPGEHRIGYFFSDGLASGGSYQTGPGSETERAIQAGTIVNTFALGGVVGAGGCAVGQNLRTLADMTGGNCTEVADPSTLQAILPMVVTTQVQTLELLVNGVVVATAAGPDPVQLQLNGIDIAGDLVAGSNTVEARTTAGDGTVIVASIMFDAVVAVPPVITCPADIVTDADAGACDTIVNFSATATGGCGGVTTDCSPVSGSVFPVGVTQVNCTATDGLGVIDQCSFTVTVNDTEDPTITCPATIVVDTDAGQCGAQIAFQTTESDNCGVDTVVCTPPAGFFAPGQTQVTCVVTDVSGNQAMCQFDVIVTDNEPPVITCPADIVASNDPGICGATVNFQVTATDNCGVVADSCSPASGSAFPIGVTQVCCTADDAAGNQSQCCFNVTVSDDEDPVITCPADIVVGPDPGVCGATVAFAATATDNCGVTASSCSPASGTLFPVGVTQVDCTASDAAGNQGMCGFTVTVDDTEAPVITCPASFALDTDPGMCGAVAAYQPTATDNCGVASVTCSPATGSFLPVGVTAVSCTATDTSGSQAVCNFDVTVNDTEAPVIGCPADIVVSNDLGVCGASVAYSPNAVDNCGSVTVSCTPASGSFFAVGVTPVSCTATDAAGNQDACGFNVTVEDTEDPVPNCPASIVADTDPGVCGATVAFQFDATDNCGVAATTCSPASGSMFPVGVSMVSCAATDTSGNQGMCMFSVTVQDTEAPSISCPGDIVVEADPAGCGGGTGPGTGGSGSGSGSGAGGGGSGGSGGGAGGTGGACTPGPGCGAIVMFAATAVDGCGVAALDCSPASGTLFLVGVTQVTCVATDTSGNQAQCVFNVQVDLPAGGCTGGGGGGGGSVGGSGSGSAGGGSGGVGGGGGVAGGSAGGSGVGGGSRGGGGGGHGGAGGSGGGGGGGGVAGGSGGGGGIAGSGHSPGGRR